MTANELRIGNYINPKVNDIVVKDEFHKVEPTTMMMILGLIDNRGIEFEPIELTPEILEKCGFGKYPTGCYCKNLKTDDSYLAIDLKYGNGVWLNIYQGKRENTIPLKHIKHLHQLQNLYFALTGQELEITL